MTLVQTGLRKCYIGSTAVKKIYKGSTKIRPAGWTPGANTVMYYPFKNDKLDHVGGSSISTSGTKEVLGYTFSSTGVISITNAPSTCRFISAWIKFNSTQGEYCQTINTYIGGVLYNFSSANPNYNKRFQYHASTSGTTLQQRPVSNQASTTTGTRYHFAYGTDGNKVVAYLNNNKIWEQSVTTVINEGGMNLLMSLDATFSDLIGESALWSAQEISDYYDLTKGNYGL